MKTEEEESAPRNSNGADKPQRVQRKKKKRTHNHIGPNVRAFRVGRAFCPSCDADKIIRLTPEEKEAERAAKEAAAAKARK